MTLRDQYRPIIAGILSAHAGKPERELRQILRDRFPHPPRQYHPYKIWLDEIRIQLGKKVPKKIHKAGEPMPQVKSCAGQSELFP